MVISSGDVPVGAEEAAPAPALPGPEGRTRRDVARGLRACALVAALTPVVAASRPPRSRSVPTDAPGGPDFDQTYRGRRVRGVWIPARGAAGGGRWHVTVDGRPLHLMRRADGTWLSMVDHYCSYPTALDTARAAVDALGPGQRLRAAPASAPLGQGHPHEGGRHGVRA
ncbi:tyrosinase family oxidase copper chaperone [Streptomyces pactum]|uniref:Tyrosinase co-factor n=1 Tax=Streptomyces pactum TaxID=68249 RepID=A0A1S6JCU8_9ACTN|nr:tyrosinase family oxidase copper chaperone [Streptomyces pactum]AQS69539.1 tyrosinase co-factor [Streptomyces pactum]